MTTTEDPPMPAPPPPGMSSDTQCLVGQLHRADGSCALAVRQTFVFASVYGPADLMMSKQKTDACVVDVNVRPAIAKPGALPFELTHIERVIRDCVEAAVCVNMLPRTLVQLTVQQLQDDGCLFEAAVNAACLALCDGSVPMRQVFCAVQLVAYRDGQSGDTHVAVSRHIQAEKLGSLAPHATFNLVFTLSAGLNSTEHSACELCASHSEGRFSWAEFERAIYVGQTEAAHWIQSYRHCLLAKFGLTPTDDADGGEQQQES